MRRLAATGAAALMLALSVSAVAAASTTAAAKFSASMLRFERSQQQVTSAIVTRDMKALEKRLSPCLDQLKSFTSTHGKSLAGGALTSMLYWQAATSGEPWFVKPSLALDQALEPFTNARWVIVKRLDPVLHVNFCQLMHSWRRSDYAFSGAARKYFDGIEAAYGVDPVLIVGKQNLAGRFGAWSGEKKHGNALVAAWRRPHAIADKWERIASRDFKVWLKAHGLATKAPV